MSSILWRLLILHILQIVPWFTDANEKDLEERSAERYLAKYGYMLPKFSLNEEEAAKNLKDAVQNFQWFAGINITGALDKETVDLMKLPRCGVIDEINVSAFLRRRRKRYILQGSMWPVRELTYKISKFTDDMQHHEIEKAIDDAFKVWSDSANISFRKLSEGKTHLTIKFEVKAHGDNYLFDGPGGTLGHAFYPKDGRIHFDDDENWIIGLGKKTGTDLLHTAVHEIGHALGLGHSNDPKAIMYGIYKGYSGKVQLNRDDIAAIQSLYGTKSKDLPREPEKKPSGERPQNAPYLCSGSGPSFDAVTYAGDQHLYAFKGDYVWSLNSETFDDIVPQLISSLWKGLPGKLDAALTWDDGSTFFFKDKDVWKYNRQKVLSPNYPQLIKDVFGLKETKIDAAFVWSGNGKTYFVKGTNYWRYDPTAYPRIHPRYPQGMEIWKGLPKHIDDAFAWFDRRTYFFSGNDYYRLKNRGVEVEYGFPKKIRIRWLGCDKGSFKSPGAYEMGNSSALEDPEDEKEPVVLCGAKSIYVIGHPFQTTFILIVIVLICKFCNLYFFV